MEHIYKGTQKSFLQIAYYMHYSTRIIIYIIYTYNTLRPKWNLLFTLHISLSLDLPPANRGCHLCLFHRNFYNQNHIKYLIGIFGKLWPSDLYSVLKPKRMGVNIIKPSQVLSMLKSSTKKTNPASLSISLLEEDFRVGSHSPNASKLCLSS